MGGILHFAPNTILGRLIRPIIHARRGEGVSNYASGANFEREISKLLKAAGFEVTRAAGSKGKLAGFDGDLIASKQTGQTKYECGVAIFQMKRTKL